MKTTLERYKELTEEAKPLLDIVSKLSVVDTEHFTISVVYKKPFERVPLLYHDWIKIVEGSLNHNDIKEKTYAYINKVLEANCLHTDFVANAKFVDENYLDGKLATVGKEVDK